MHGFKLATAAFVLSAILGCGPGVDESKFSSTPGAAAAGAPQTPAELDAKTPKPKL
jgi:hypothetical protein